MANPVVITSEGLTPQQAIVNGDGTATTFFFRWLLAMRGTIAIVASAFGSGPVIRDLLANIPTRLNAGDDGRIFEATDYCHRWRWDGAALRWRFAAGEASGYVVAGQPDGSAPNGGLWGLCDGTACDVAQDTGAVVSVTTQNLTGGAFIKGDTPTAQQAATAATWQAGAQTDSESAHIHTVDPPAAVTNNDAGAGEGVQAGSGSTLVADHPHQHTFDISPFSSGPGTAHAHTFSDANAKLNPPSDANGGLPLRIGVQFYMRR